MRLLILCLLVTSCWSSPAPNPQFAPGLYPFGVDSYQRGGRQFGEGTIDGKVVGRLGLLDNNGALRVVHYAGGSDVVGVGADDDESVDGGVQTVPAVQPVQSHGQSEVVAPVVPHQVVVPQVAPQQVVPQQVVSQPQIVPQQVPQQVVPQAVPQQVVVPQSQPQPIQPQPQQYDQTPIQYGQFNFPLHYSGGLLPLHQPIEQHKVHEDDLSSVGENKSDVLETPKQAEVKPLVDSKHGTKSYDSHDLDKTFPVVHTERRRVTEEVHVVGGQKTKVAAKQSVPVVPAVTKQLKYPYYPYYQFKDHSGNIYQGYFVPWIPAYWHVLAKNQKQAAYVPYHQPVSVYEPKFVQVASVPVPIETQPVKEEKVAPKIKYVTVPVSNLEPQYGGYYPVVDQQPIEYVPRFQDYQQYQQYYKQQWTRPQYDHGFPVYQGYPGYQGYQQGYQGYPVYQGYQVPYGNPNVGYFQSGVSPVAKEVPVKVTTTIKQVKKPVTNWQQYGPYGPGYYASEIDVKPEEVAEVPKPEEIGIKPVIGISGVGVGVQEVPQIKPILYSHLAETKSK